MKKLNTLMLGLGVVMLSSCGGGNSGGYTGAGSANYGATEQITISSTVADAIENLKNGFD